MYNYSLDHRELGEQFLVLKDSKPEYFQYHKNIHNMLEEIYGLTPKIDINFSINLMPGIAPFSKIPYRMSTPELKEL